MTINGIRNCQKSKRLIGFSLNRDEKITTEAAVMVFIQGNIRTETKMGKGGFSSY